jgi:hypothetical protein
MSKLIKYSGATIHSLWEQKYRSLKIVGLPFQTVVANAPQYLAIFSCLEIHHYIYGSYPFDMSTFIPANTQRCCAEVKLQTCTGPGKFPKKSTFTCSALSVRVKK